MRIESIRHKALRRFAQTGNAKGVMQAERIRDMPEANDMATLLPRLAALRAALDADRN